MTLAIRLLIFAFIVGVPHSWARLELTVMEVRENGEPLTTQPVEGQCRVEKPSNGQIFPCRFSDDRSRGSILGNGDRLITGAAITTKLALNELAVILTQRSEVTADTEEIWVMPNSRMEVREQGILGAAGRFYFNLRRVFDAELKRITLGVKGTAFEVDVQDSEVQVRLLEGQVDIRENGSDRLITSLTDGSLAVIRDDQGLSSSVRELSGAEMAVLAERYGLVAANPEGALPGGASPLFLTQTSPITREELVEAMKALPATEVNAQIKSRGLAFPLEESDVPDLFSESGRPVSEMAALIPTLKELLPQAISPEEAAPRIDEIFGKLALGSPVDAIGVIHSAILDETGEVLSVFDPEHFSKYSLGTARQLPGGRLGVPLYVFGKDGAEHLHFAQFLADADGSLKLRELSGTRPETANLHLGAELDLAENRIRELYRSQFDMQDQVAERIMTPALSQSLQERGGWGRLTQGSRPTQSDLQIERSVNIDGKSILSVVHVKHPAGDGMVEYYADFERVDGDLRMVRLRDRTGEGDVAADPRLNEYICERYDTTGCSTYQMRQTADPAFLSNDALADTAERLLTDFKGEELRRVAERMRQGTTNDEDPTGLSYLASAKFLLGEFYEAEQLAELAIEKGADVRIPVLQYFQDSTTGAHWFGRLLLGLSEDGLEYRPSNEIAARKFPEMSMAWSQVGDVTVGSKKNGAFGIPGGGGTSPFLRVKVEFPNPERPGKTQKEEWDIAIYPSGCVTPGQKFSGEMMQPTGFNACGTAPSTYAVGSPGDISGGIVSGAPPVNTGLFSSIKKGENAPTSLLVPREWEQAAISLQRLLAKYQK